MSAISKDDVLNLREKTGAGLIDCKRALIESAGDLDEAVSILRKKGIASAAKKAGRDAGEGIIAQSVSDDKSKGILVEVNCETDFVAKNEDFISFANKIAQMLLDEPEADLESFRTDQVAKIGENIRISRSQSLQTKENGLVESYVHTGAKVAVLLSLGTSSAAASGDSKVLSLAKDMCMHIAATSPVCVRVTMSLQISLPRRKKLPKLKPKESRHKLLKRSFKVSLRNIFLIPVFLSSHLSRTPIIRSSNSYIQLAKKLVPN
jgi:elongation factor Ts